MMLRARRSEPDGDDDDIAVPTRHHVIIMERPAVDRAPRPPLIFDDKLLAFEKIARAEGAVAVEGAEYLHQHPAEIFMKIADARQFPVEQRGNLAAILVDQTISGPIVAEEHDEFAGVGHGIGEPLTRERYHRKRLTFVDIQKLAPVIIGTARRLLGIGVGYFETGQRPGAPVIGMNGHQMVEKLIADRKSTRLNSSH